jgi:hypothetical protein
VRHTPLEGDDRLRFFVDELGMKEEIIQQLPLDTPTPLPPGSQTAQVAALENRRERPRAPRTGAAQRRAADCL